MENSDIKLFVCGDVKAPQRAKGDAGIDFFVPNFSEQFLKDLTDKWTRNHQHQHQHRHRHRGQDHRSTKTT